MSVGALNKILAKTMQKMLLLVAKAFYLNHLSFKEYEKDG
jgi:hypothetical protein